MSRCMKRLFDVAASVVFLVVFSPALLLICALIKMTSKGTALFRQRRLGYRGQEFEILKFRTMVMGAEHMGLGLAVAEGDSRITRVGRILRKTSIDEIPQLINVIKGEMSIVGPRPPATYFPYDSFEEYPEWAKRRFDVRPGITGYAQVRGRNSLTWDERMLLDVEYVERWSLWLDLKIIFMTVGGVASRKGIYGAEDGAVEAVYDRREGKK